MDCPYRPRVDARLRLIDAFDLEIDTVSRQLRARLCHDPGYLEIQRIPRRRLGPGSGVRRRDRRGWPVPRRRASGGWVGLTPKHRESNTKVHRGLITQPGQRPGPLGARTGVVTRLSGKHGCTFSCLAFILPFWGDWMVLWGRSGSLSVPDSERWKTTHDEWGG